MKKVAWFVLSLDVLADFIITGGGVITGAIAATGSQSMPASIVWISAIVFGVVAGAKTLRQALNDAMKGKPFDLLGTVVETTTTKTVETMPATPLVEEKIKMG